MLWTSDSNPPSIRLSVDCLNAIVPALGFDCNAVGRTEKLSMPKVGSSCDAWTNVRTTYPNVIGSPDDEKSGILPPKPPKSLGTRPVKIKRCQPVSAFAPVKDPCGATGQSYLYALYYLTGSAYSTPVIGTDPGTGGKEYNKRATDLGVGMAARVVVHIGKGGSSGAMKAFVQKSTAELAGIDINAPGEIVSRLITWFEGEN